MTNILNKAKEILFKVTATFTCAWIAFALSFQMYAIYLTVSGQEQEMTRISNEISWKIDGTFKNNPENIWYEGDQKQ
jgi:hypothetical protein